MLIQTVCSVVDHGFAVMLVLAEVATNCSGMPHIEFHWLNKQNHADVKSCTIKAPAF